MEHYVLHRSISGKAMESPVLYLPAQRESIIMQNKRRGGSILPAQRAEKGFLDGVTGVYHTPEGYFVDEKEVEKFDANFPPKEKLKLPGQLV